MSYPASLQRFNREGLPLLHARMQGETLLTDVEQILSTDRWNSFDQFHRTSRYVRDRFAEAGARTEVYPVPTRGPDGSGHWRIQQASDVKGATLDIIHPIRRRVLDFQKNPWHVVQWSAATPREGVESELVVIDDWETLRRVPAESLQGRWILTRLSPWHAAHEFVRTGADGLLTGNPMGPGCGRTPLERQLETATEWTKLGWSGLPMEQAGLSLVALAIPGDENVRLRALIRRHGRVRIRARVDVRRYVGTHDLTMGVVPGWGDPQEEVWVLSHSAEPGASDNASGMAICLSAATALERAIRDGVLPRPRRSIRFLIGYECYSFFHYLEHGQRLQPALAGMVADSLGYHPRYCKGRLNWHASMPASAGFVDAIGESILRATLRVDNPGYHVVPQPFVSTDDTLVGDPKYGFPCPWMNMHYKADGVAYEVYHTSADVPALMSPRGLRVAAAATAGYVHYLADAESVAMLEMARTHTDEVLADLALQPRRTRSWAQLRRTQHAVSLKRLQRWMWGGDRKSYLRHLSAMEAEVRHAANSGRCASHPIRALKGSNRVAYRTRLLAPDLENIAPDIRQRLRDSGMDRRPLFWADGERTIRQITELHAAQSGAEPNVARMQEYFEAMGAVGFVKLVPSSILLTRKTLTRDLQALGLRPGMDVIVHSSLSRIGFVRGGANTVINAVLEALGREGTLLAPSFNHGGAAVYNPRTTPTTNGVIADTLWRRPDAGRSLQGTHAVAAIGPRAQFYLEGHLEAGIWGMDSPIGRLVQRGGYVLCLGVSPEVATVYHIAEMASPGRCLEMFKGLDRLVQADGMVVPVPGLLWRKENCPVSVSRLEAGLDRRGQLKRGTVGAAASLLFNAKDLFIQHRRNLAKVCPTCKVRPDPSWKPKA
jgi:aminoglycoside 3-N-acetyltransferase